MKISPLLITNNINLPIRKPNAPSFYGQTACDCFVSRNETGEKYSQKYYDAVKYLNQTKKSRPSTNLISYDLKKLDGLQEGIKVFEGLPMTKIAFLLTRVNTLAVLRGCNNKCVHCYADAKPAVPLKDEKTSDTLRSMSWEDFCSLTDGVKELNNRLGFKVRQTHSGGYMYPFYDSDCIDLVVKDKNGKEHDFIDYADKIYDSFGAPVVFDTSGWTQKNEKSQKRAEKFVEYFLDPENKDKVLLINVSINPFHKLNAEYVDNIISDPIKARKFRELYTDRMANVLYTFTPLYNSGKLDVISRALSDEYSNPPGFKTDDMNILADEIITKLKKKYADNHVLGAKEYAREFTYMIENVDTINIAQGKLRNLLFEDSPLVKAGDDCIEKTSELDVLHKRNDFYGVLDANGKAYFTDYLMSYKTDIQLNFENKDKKTPPIEPMLQDETVTVNDFEKWRERYA